MKKSIRWDARGVRLALVTASGFGEMSCFSSDLAIQITGIRFLSCEWLGQAQGYEDVVKNLPLIDEALGQGLRAGPKAGIRWQC